MIIFKKIRWQNLLSTGNQFTEVDLNRLRTTLIVGTNGAGKSTILDALFFALYGKAFRNINKPLLVNSITNKGLLVELEFSIGTKEYKVRRGIKPNIFEIYQNEQLIDQTADAREYQEMLENQIIKMNSKAFSQIVVLGSAGYIPFMLLTAADRRAVIEDLLDLQIFSVMNTILKQRVSQNKDALIEADHQVDLSERAIESQQKNIEAITANNDDLITKKKDMIKKLQNDLTIANTELDQLQTDIGNLQVKILDRDKVSKRKMKILDIQSKLETRIAEYEKEVKFYSENDNCPTCEQPIEEEFKENKTNELQEKSKEVHEGLISLKEELTIVKDRSEEIETIVSEVETLGSQLTNKASDIRSTTNHIRSLNEELEELQKDNGLLEDCEKEIERLRTEKEEWVRKRVELNEEKKILTVSGKFLKDTGIKTKIIRQYIPIINQIVNKYLQALNFFVAFELDEKFNETIKSRHRDAFSYSSFSEGEKFRIDISLMLTWREIAKIRNSAATNLLIMDEVFDSSLDAEGTDEFMKLLDILAEDTNIFVISHKGDMLYDKFHSVIKFEKNKNFSRIAK